MGRYVARRVSLVPLMIFALLTGMFIISHIVPTDPARAWAGTPDSLAIEAVREEYGLNKPLHIQYFSYIFHFLKGDLGISAMTKRPVIVDLLYYFPHTIELAIFAMIISLVGVPAGIISALKRNKAEDHGLRIFSLLGFSMPSFWVAIIFQLTFYYYIGVLPGYGLPEVPRITGFAALDSLLNGDFNLFLDVLKHMVMPATVLSYPAISLLTRMVRSSMLEVLSKDYITAARAKGLRERIVIFRHALRNALIATTTMAGLISAWFLGGAVAIEAVFGYPGMGRYAVTAAVDFLDFPAIMGVTLVIGLTFVIINTIVDVLYAYLDPRIQLR